MRKSSLSAQQLGFDALLADADRTNSARRVPVHPDFPGDMDAGIAFCRTLIDRHRDAMLHGDLAAALGLRKQAHALAFHLNDGDPGILASESAAGCVLDRATAAKPGDVPLWGQSGCFILAHGGFESSIAMDGLFGTGACALPYLGFAARVVDAGQPFLSETGFRSFLGFVLPPQTGLTVEAYVGQAIAHYVKTALKGRLVRVKPLNAPEPAC